MPNPFLSTMWGNGSRDPFGSAQGFMGKFRNFMQNPAQTMTQNKLNLPDGWMQNPNGAIQQLMNDGRMTQEQYNALSQMAGRIQQMPQWQQMMGNGQQNSQGNSNGAR